MRRNLLLSAAVFLLAAVSTAFAGPEVPPLISGRPIPEILEMIQSPADLPDPAIVQVLLKNGHSFEGSVSEYSRTKSTCTLRDRNSKMTVINPADISAVTLLHPGNAKRKLLGGKIYRESRDAPTFLALRREAEKISAGFDLKLTVSLPETEAENLDCRFYSGMLLSALETALKDITKDAAGKEALSKFNGGLTLNDKKAVAAPSVEKQGNLLSVQFDCRNPLVDGYEQALLKAMSDVL